MEAYKKVIWGSLIVVVLLILPLIIYFFFIQPKETVPIPPPRQAGIEPQVQENPEDRPEAEPKRELPVEMELNSSDLEVRKLLKDVSGEPDYITWLANSDIIRRVVAVTSNVANGSSPQALLPFMAPTGKFRIKKENGDIFIDPRSYHRYRGIVTVLESLDGKQLIGIFRRVQPLFDEAYGELGYPGESFETVLKRAIHVILKTPIQKGAVRLEEKVTSYAFADPELEELSSAQKHLLRMGPDNGRRIKKKLKQILELLENREIKN